MKKVKIDGIVYDANELVIVAKKYTTDKTSKKLMREAGAMPHIYGTHKVARAGELNKKRKIYNIRGHYLGSVD